MLSPCDWNSNFSFYEENNNKLRQEQITYIPFITIWVLRVRNEVNIAAPFERQLLLLKRESNKTCLRDGLRWHAMRKVYNVSALPPTANKTSVDTVVPILSFSELLLCRLTHYVPFVWYTTRCLQSFIIISSGIQVILRSSPQQFEMLQCWSYWWKNLWIKLLIWSEVVGTYIHTYIHTGFHIAQLRQSSNIIVSAIWEASVHIAHGRDLWCAPLRWPQVAWYTYQFSYRSVQAFKLC
jgi:hypothetical protein